MPAPIAVPAIIMLPARVPVVTGRLFNSVICTACEPETGQSGTGYPSSGITADVSCFFLLSLALHPYKTKQPSLVRNRHKPAAAVPFSISFSAQPPCSTNADGAQTHTDHR